MYSLRIIILCLLANAVNAQNTSDPFSNLDISVIDIEQQEEDKPYNFSGYFAFDVGYSPQRQDNINLSKFRVSTLLQLNMQLSHKLDWHASLSSFYDFAYDYNDDVSFNQQTIDEYESQLEVYELYFNYAFRSNVKVKLGRQIIVWGNSEVDRIIDIVTPLDLREIGTRDIGDQRLPVTALRLTAFFDPWQLDFALLPEIRPDRLPTQGSGFDIFSNIRNANTVLLNAKEPSSGINNLEVAINLKRFFPSGDFSLIAASVFDDQPYLEFIRFSDQNLILQPQYRKLSALGFSTSYSSGAILWKAEAITIHNKALTRKDLAQQLLTTAEIRSWLSKDISRYMLGFEYSGIENLFASVEYIGQVIHEYDQRLAVAKNSHSLGVVLRHTALYDKLESTLTTVYDFAGSGGVFLRLGFQYELNQHINVGVNYTNFQSDDQQNSVFVLRNSDRIDLSLTYGF
jgi:hypothetical protein